MPRTTPRQDLADALEKAFIVQLIAELEENMHRDMESSSSEDSDNDDDGDDSDQDSYGRGETFSTNTFPRSTRLILSLEKFNRYVGIMNICLFPLTRISITTVIRKRTSEAK